MASIAKKSGKIHGSAEVKGYPGRVETNRETAARDTDGTSVTATIGLTLSENFQSVRVEAAVTLPTTLSEKEMAMLDAWSFVDREVASRMKDAKKLMSAL